MIEIFKTEQGDEITVEPMWGEYRMVLHMDGVSRIFKTGFATRDEAMAALRANSTPRMVEQPRMAFLRAG